MSEWTTPSLGMPCDRCAAPAREIGYDTACPEAETWTALCCRHASEATLRIPAPRAPSDRLIARVLMLWREDVSQ